MSKQIKQMEMDALKGAFKDVRDLVVLSASGVDAQADNRLRLTLRKKNIRLQVVKNSLTRRVFDELGFKLSKDSACWQGATLLAWGGSSISELARELEAQVADLVKKNAALKDKVKFKGAIADGQEITFAQGKAMPTKAEAIGRVIRLALSPAARLVSQLRGPASTIAGQIKTLSEKKPEEAPAEAAAPPA